MWCWLHIRSTWSHVSASRELQIGHAFDGNICMPKNSRFLAIPMYWLVRSFRRLVFCESIIAGLDQQLSDSLLSIYGFIVHIQMLGNCCAIISKFFLRVMFFYAGF